MSEPKTSTETARHSLSLGKIAVLVSLTAVLGGSLWFAHGTYQCSRNEEHLRNLIFQDAQQMELERNMGQLRGAEAPDLSGMRERRQAEMEELMATMLDNCGELSVDTAIRKSATEDFGL